MTLQRQKELLIAVFVSLYSLLFFLGFQLVVNQSNIWGTPAAIIIGVGALIWCALMTCATAYVVNRSGSNVIVAAIAPILIYLISRLRLDALIGSVVVFAILIGVQRRLSWELSSRVNVHVIPVFSGATRLTIYALLVSLITLTVPALAESFDNNRIAIPPQYIATVISPMESVIKGMLPGYSSGSTIDEMIDEQLRAQAPNATPAELAAGRALIRPEFSRRFGVNVTGRETLPDILAGTINKYLRQLAQDNRLIAIGFLIALTFLTVRVFVPLLVWPALFLINIFLRLSEQIGLITILKTQVTVERISL